MDIIFNYIKSICKKRGILVHFKPTKTLRNCLVKPKDKNSKENQRGVNYHIHCSDEDCDHTYVGETKRALGERVKEHATQNSSAFTTHREAQGHPPPSMENTSILHREGRSFLRYIKESIFIRTLSPVLNRIVGKLSITLYLEQYN